MYRVTRKDRVGYKMMYDKVENVGNKLILRQLRWFDLNDIYR